MRLNERAIKRLSLPDRGNKIHYDEEVPGFGLRLTKAGAPAFVVNYRVKGEPAQGRGAYSSGLAVAPAVGKAAA